MDNPTAYPLSWPLAAKRARFRRDSPFKKRTWGQALNELELELKRLKATHIVISSNVRDRSGRGAIDEPGVACYFRRRGTQQVIACDQYRIASDNAWAIAKTIEALRAIERHGSSELGDQAFSAFAELPAAGETTQERKHRHWREVLGVPDGIPREDQLDLAVARWRKGMAANHPDRGGDAFLAEELNGAIARAKEELR